MPNSRPFVSIILAGGRGTRMGSSDKHKVCFEVLGVPVILRALETYNLSGASLNVVVVGMLAEGVMATINPRFPGTVYAFQEKSLGTGNATRKAAEILERMNFEGDILVVAGDKVIEPRVIQDLLRRHRQSGADVTLATAKRPANSSAGILIRSARGNIVGILEEAERRRLLAVAELTRCFDVRMVIPAGEIEQIVARHCTGKTAARLLAEFWPEGSPRESLARDAFEHLFSADERLGCLRVGRQVIPVAEVLQRFDQMNLSTYLFRAPVLYDALARLKPARATQEEYLTDVFEILAGRKRPARVIGCEIDDPRDLMAFNNPQELLAVEAVWREKQGQRAVGATAEAGQRLLRAGEWDALLQSPTPALRRQLWQCYGDDIPWADLRSAVQAFMRRFGDARPVTIVRSPGRINLLGRHVDHQGGPVNVMAINREIFAVASPRPDDAVCLANADESHFATEQFAISGLVASLNWDDWQRVIDGPRLQRILEHARGNWANYAKASILRLQEQFRDRQLRGMDVMVSGSIPMGAGLSSSSALVVAMAETVTAFNRLPVSGRRLVSLCGEGEWFVGTRGGAADHAAIKLSRRGYVTRVGFFPFRIEDSAPFLAGHDLVVCNSGIYAGKSHGARNTFNSKVTAYHIGRIWFKMLRPDLAQKIQHLRDLTPANLGVSREAFARLLMQLPARLTRAQVQSAAGQMAESDRARLEQMFLSHEPPPGGYAVRDVVLFGLSEMARARKCLDLLQRKQARALGRLMSLSHDGDRVSRQNARGLWKRIPAPVAACDTSGLAEPGRPRRSGRPVRGKTPLGALSPATDIAELCGAYACSLPELDRIVDLARTVPGVEGAQLAGAGLGGCVMVLVQQPHTRDLLAFMNGQGIPGEVFRPIAGASTLMA